MRAAVFEEYGPPEVVRVTEVPAPKPTSRELLVRVHASTVNRTDTHYRSARPAMMRLFSGLAKPRRTILGCEFAGRVEATGSAVVSFSVGDRVFGWCGWSYGAHAEYLVIPADGCVARIPPDLSFEEAAPGTEGAHYANTHIGAARIRSGHDVLVYGASGAIGTAAVQLLKSRDVRVTAVCASSQVDLVKRLGADRVIDYLTQDYTQDEQRYDALLDACGHLSYLQSRHLLKPGGRYTSTGPGPYWSNFLLLPVQPLLREKVVFSFPKIDQSTVQQLAQLMETGQFRPVVDRPYRLEQIVDAHRYVDTGRKTGNVVITITPEA
jgi:NADPH:quinone reductase-like Zn-dependent oxidoreductase